MNDVAPDLLVRLLIDQAERWNRGQAPAIESYLDQYPALRVDETILDLISNEIYVRCSRNDVPSLAEYRERFPHLADQIEVQLQLHQSAGTLKNGALWRSAASLPARPAAAAFDLRPVVPGYELLDELGRGAMGVVYKARQTSLKRIVALKVTHTGGKERSTLQARFRLEAAAVARLQHANIVQIFEVGDYEDSSYISLELVGGGSLAQRLKGEPLSELDAAQCVQTLARAMHYAHRRGVIHRDLKPANILLTPSGALKITDFGLARQLKDGRRLTRIGDILGTPSYMAPEQANGDPDALPAADIYSLGVILYELLTGKPPFTGESAWATLLMVGYTAPEPPSRVRPSVPPDLDAICLKCLQKDPNARYGTAKELAEELDRFQHGRPVRARPLTLRRRFAAWARRTLTQAAVVLGVLLSLAIVLGAGAFMGAHWQRSHPAVIEPIDSTDEPEKTAPSRLVADSNQNVSETEDADEAQCTLEAERFAHEALRDAETERVAARQAQVEAEKRQQEAGVRLEQTRRDHYAQQLLDVAAIWQREPVLARQMLDDAARCPADLRDFTWELLDSTCNRPRVAFPAQPQNVLAVAVSSEGKIACAGRDGTVRLLDQTGGERQIANDPKHKVYAVAFAPDGQHLASGGSDQTVRIWNKSGKLSHTLDGHKAPIYALTYSGDGKTLASADETGWIRIWDPSSKKEKNSFQSPSILPAPAAIQSLAFSPDAKLISAGDDSVIRRWNWNKKEAQLAGILNGHAGPVQSIAFSPDGKLFVSAGNDGAIRLWSYDKDTAALKHVMSQFAGELKSVAFSPDGKFLACGAKKAPQSPPCVKLWDTATGLPIATMMTEDSVNAVAFLDDKRLVVAAGKRVEIRSWSLEPAALRRQVPALAAAVSPHGQIIAAEGQNHAIELIDAATGAVRHTLSGPASNPTTLAFKPDDSQLVSGSADGLLRLWDSKSGKLKYQWEAHLNGVACAVFSPDAAILVSGGQDRLVKLWNPHNGELIKTLAGHGAAIAAIAISRDGKLLASGSSEGALKLWDLPSGGLVRTLPGSGDAVQSLAFLADALAAAGQDGKARLFDLASGKTRLTLPAGHGPVSSLTGSPDGRTLVVAASTKVGAGQIRLLDPVFGEVRGVLPVHASVTAVAFSADGRRLVSACSDKTIEVWEAGGP